MPRLSDSDIASVAAALRLDLVAAEVVESLDEAGIPSILLKGRALARMLYDDAARGYVDVDVLVPEERRDAAGERLAALGFERDLADDEEAAWIPRHATNWHRADDNAAIDLHTTLRGLDSPPAAVWRGLSAHAVETQVGGRPARALDPAGMALNVAAHAAARGVEQEKPVEDLRRAIDRLPRPVWDGAAELAARVGGTAALADGLAVLAEGEELVAALGLRRGGSVQVALDAAAAPVAAHGIEEIARTPGLAAKGRIVARALFPPPAFMRKASPLAARGPAGLALAYVRRPLWLAFHAPGAVRAWGAARRAAARGGPPHGD